MRFFIKILLSALIIALAAETGRRLPKFGALIVSLPLSSILVLLWMHLDGTTPQALAEMSRGIFWAVIPSLIFLQLFPALLKSGFSFYPALLTAIAAMLAGYGIYLLILRKSLI